MPSPLQRIRTLALGLERSVKQYRWLLRYAHSKRVRKFWMSQRNDAVVSNEKRCLLDLRRIANDGEQGRRFHALAMLLNRGGYSLSLVPRLQFLQTGDRAFKASALSFIQPFCEDDLPADFRPFDLCLSDRRGEHRHADRTIEVLADTKNPLATGDLALPYSFYPDVWNQCDDHDFDAYRRHRRVWRFFFGGYCSKQSYRRIKKYSRLQPVDRYSAVREVNRYFAHSTIEICSHRQLLSAQAARHESFVMIDNTKYRPDANRWLGLLAQSDFFLAAPGCDYPLSHNAIEAIAVGTIPVLEYDSLFTPALRDGENCIAYRGMDGLRDAASRVDAMNQHEIERLRSGVIQYYESHLSPAAFCKRLESDRTNRLHLFSYLTPAAKQAA